MRRSRRCREFEKRIEAIQPQGRGSTLSTRSDREMVLGNIRSHAADAGDDSALGEESGQLFERCAPTAPSR